MTADRTGSDRGLLPAAVAVEACDDDGVYGGLGVGVAGLRCFNVLTGGAYAPQSSLALDL